jgi:hypothetical protein
MHVERSKMCFRVYFVKYFQARVTFALRTAFHFLRRCSCYAHGIAKQLALCNSNRRGRCRIQTAAAKTCRMFTIVFVCLFVSCSSCLFVCLFVFKMTFAAGSDQHPPSYKDPKKILCSVSQERCYIEQPRNAGENTATATQRHNDTKKAAFQRCSLIFLFWLWL